MVQYNTKPSFHNGEGGFRAFYCGGNARQIQGLSVSDDRLLSLWSEASVIMLCLSKNILKFVFEYR